MVKIHGSDWTLQFNGRQNTSNGNLQHIQLNSTQTGCQKYVLNTKRKLSVYYCSL